MSKILFKEEDIIKLKNNVYVKEVSSKGITYTDEFKTLFIAEHTKGKMPSQIFKDSGFDVEMIGQDRINSASKRWRKAYKQLGELGLRDTRKTNIGRPLSGELTMEKQLAKKDAEIAYLRAEVELLKKIEMQERQVKNGKMLSSRLIFEITENIVKKHNIKRMVKYLCAIAGVSRSGYYAYICDENSRDERERQDEALLSIILKAFNHRGYKKGSRSIKMVLEQEFNIIYNRKRIQRIMRKYGIICPVRKANPYRRMMKATREHTVVPNRLNRNFKQNIACKILLTDITYLPYGTNQTAYLSTIKDASADEILSYHLSDNLRLDIATETIEKLIKRHRSLLHTDAFVHSDQGVHYTSPKFRKLLKKYKLGQSMSRRGNCWDNAPPESFFGHLKDEIDYKSCTTFGQLQLMIDEYMDYYNNYRFQWGLKKLTPVQFRNQLFTA